MWDGNREHFRSDLDRDGAAYFMWWSTAHKTITTGWGHPSIESTFNWVIKQPEWLQPKNGKSLRSVLLSAPRISSPAWMRSTEGVTGTSVLQAYYFILLSRGMGMPTDIVELGAGYGEMARILIELGYPGIYRIVDFPELVEIQKYYLGQAGVLDRVEFVNKVSTPGCLVSICALSEAPIDAEEDWGGRDEAIRGARDHFVVFQEEFLGMNNGAYFREALNAPSQAAITGHQYIIKRG